MSASSMENQEYSLSSLQPRSSTRNGRRLLLFPFPFQGHINPMLQLANILHSKGFGITIIHSTFNSPNQSNYPHFKFQSIDDGALFKTKESVSDINIIPNLLTNCVEPFRDCLARLLSKEPIPCLIADALWHFTQAVADSFELPRIVLRTSSLSCFLVFADLPILREKGYFDHTLEDHGWEWEWEAPVPEFPTLKQKDIPKIFTSNLDNIFEIIANMVKGTKAASGMIWNSCKELEEPAFANISQDIPKPSFAIGPFHKYFSASSSSLLAQDPTSISWLDSQEANSVLYVSLGSVSCIDETEFLEMAWGLANSLQPFLWVVRQGSVRGSEWLECLPEGFMDEIGARGHIVKWAPQQQVLAHSATGGFWSHCGWNSTLESICEGVAMICSPRFGDQPINARYVTDVWKIGLGLEKGLMEREEIKKTIGRIMVDKEGQEIRERITCLRESVEVSLKEGGSSCESLESLVNYIMSF